MAKKAGEWGEGTGLAHQARFSEYVLSSPRRGPGSTAQLLPASLLPQGIRSPVPGPQQKRAQLHRDAPARCAVLC